MSYTNEGYCHQCGSECDRSGSCQRCWGYAFQISDSAANPDFSQHADFNGLSSRLDQYPDPFYPGFGYPQSLSSKSLPPPEFSNSFTCGAGQSSLRISQLAADQSQDSSAAARDLPRGDLNSFLSHTGSWSQSNSNGPRTNFEPLSRSTTINLHAETNETLQQQRKLPPLPLTGTRSDSFRMSGARNEGSIIASSSSSGTIISSLHAKDGPLHALASVCESVSGSEPASRTSTFRIPKASFSSGREKQRPDIHLCHGCHEWFNTFVDKWRRDVKLILGSTDCANCNRRRHVDFVATSSDKTIMLLHKHHGARAQQPQQTSENTDATPIDAIPKKGPFYCSVHRCKRSEAAGGKPFNRKDNRNEHELRVHGKAKPRRGQLRLKPREKQSRGDPLEEMLQRGGRKPGPVSAESMQSSGSKIEEDDLGSFAPLDSENWYSMDGMDGTMG